MYENNTTVVDNTKFIKKISLLFIAFVTALLVLLLGEVDANAGEYRCNISTERGVEGNLTDYTFPTTAKSPVYSDVPVWFNFAATSDIKLDMLDIYIYKDNSLYYNHSFNYNSYGRWGCNPFSYLHAGYYECKWRYSDVDSSEIKELGISFTVCDPPTITKHPSGVQVSENASHTFSVGAKGGKSSLTYQWYYATSSSGSGTMISNATSSSYSVTASYSNSGRYYYCKVSDGERSVTTSRAKMTTMYPIRYDANGGYNAPSTVYYKLHGDAITLSTTKPIRSGYTFLGWSIDKNATTATYASGDSYTSNSSATLYAVWKDTTVPTGSISSTNNVASSQTVTLSLSDSAGIAGYYWGTSSSYSSNSYWSTNFTSVTKTVYSSGTYYLTVKDTNGNLSTTKSITFYETTLNANGGSVNLASVLTAQGKSFTFPTPTRSGYTYLGWSTSNSATSGVKTLTPTSNATYYAVWSKKDTTAPSGSISSTNEVASSQIVTLNMSDNVGVAGYYWGTSSSYSSNSYYSTSATKVTKTVSSPGTYYLRVKDTNGNLSTTKSITFYKTILNSNGGSVNLASVLTAQGKSFTFPTLTRSGYTYLGWSTSNSATSGVKTLTPTSNANYYAVWSKKDTTAPSGSISSTNKVASSQTVTLNLSDNYGIAGYYWGTSSSYSSNSYYSTSATKVTKTISSPGTYYLTVKDTSGYISTTKSITFYKTTLNANGGNVNPASVLTAQGKSFTFPIPTRGGYTYVGWSTSSSATSGVKTLYPTKKATYYAVWKDTMAPSGSISSTNKVASKQTVTLKLSDNIRVAGYYWGTVNSYFTNAYWSSSASKVTKTVSSPGTYYLTVKDTNSNISTTKSITFYKTSFDANGGKVSGAVVLTKKGNSFKAPTPTRSGYTFKGWATSTKATSGKTTIKPTKSTKYYAIWAANKPSITLKNSSYTKTYGSKAFSLGVTTKRASKVAYKSSSTSVVKVSGSGKVTIVGCGKATITVKATNSKGSVTKKITVLVTPKKLKINSAKKVNSKTLKITYSKQKNASGYVLEYSTNAKFKNAKTKKLSSKASSVQLGNLKKGQYYHVRIRAYKTVSNKNYYGEWAKAKFYI